ncbi:MAG: hypothetical protein ACLVKN_19370 [Flavonifractor plautii]
MILASFYAVFHMFQIAAIYVVVLALVGGSTDPPAWQALGFYQHSGPGGPQPLQPAPTDPRRLLHGGEQAYSIGDKLKRVPMGYFNDQSLGELTGTPPPFWTRWRASAHGVGRHSGLTTPAVMLLCVLLWDWRIARWPWRGCWCIWPFSGMEKQSAKIALKRQRTRLGWWRRCWSAQGMSVIKS